MPKCSTLPEPGLPVRRPERTGPGGSEPIIAVQVDPVTETDVAEPTGRRRLLGRARLAWRIGVALAGIALLLNGSARMSDDVWPFGPLSQYAFSPTYTDTVVITRVEGELADGQRIDLPLRVGESGIGRAEIEAQIPEIESHPKLLNAVADGWSRLHPSRPKLVRVWLVQDHSELSHGKQVSAQTVELASWRLPA